MRATMEVRATLVGYIWMPNVPAWKDVQEKLCRQDRPFTLHVERGTTTREVLERVMTAHGGDFSSCHFLDCTLTLCRGDVRRGRHYGRTFDLREGRDVDDYFVPVGEREDWECRMMDACGEED